MCIGQFYLSIAVQNTTSGKCLCFPFRFKIQLLANACAFVMEWKHEICSLGFARTSCLLSLHQCHSSNLTELISYLFLMEKAVPVLVMLLKMAPCKISNIVLHLYLCHRALKSMSMNPNIVFHRHSISSSKIQRVDECARHVRLHHYAFSSCTCFKEYINISRSAVSMNSSIVSSAEWDARSCT
jgi:hypothetical protein